MKKYKKVKYEVIISIDNEEEEESAKEILRQYGWCLGVECRSCLFHIGNTLSCFEPYAIKRVGILKEMGVKE